MPAGDDMGTSGGIALAVSQGGEDIAGDSVDFSIGEVATLVGVSPHTIRAWERRQACRPPSSGSGQMPASEDR